MKSRFARSSGFQNFRHATRTIKGIETIHALYKKEPHIFYISANFATELFLLYINETIVCDQTPVF